MKKLFTYLFFSCLSVPAIATDTTKVLFIGNSFTATHDVPQMIKGFADAAGLPMKIMSHAPGGISVGDVSQGTMAHMNNPIVFDLISSDNWNYVVLQDNQGRFVDGGGNFPNPAQSKVVDGHIKIRDSMRKHNPCARMLLFSGWAWKDGYPGLGDGVKLINNIYENYYFLNKTANEVITPIGPAWLRAKVQLPAIDLWGPDGAHQSVEGSYLTGAVIFSSIYRMDIANNAFTGGVDPVSAGKMRAIAAATVNDSLTGTKLSQYIPTISYAGTVLTASTGYTKYEWFKNGALVATTTANTYTAGPAGTDCYQVMVTDNKNCKQRSALVCKATTISVGQVAQVHELSISPNPAADRIQITMSTASATSKKYTITDITGHVLATGTFTGEKMDVTVSTLPSGLYFCNIYADDMIWRGKFVKAD